MLCKICVGMIRDRKGSVWKGTFEPRFAHHATTKSLRRSAKADCSICTVLARILRDENNVRDQSGSIELSVSANKFSASVQEGTWYRLDFELKEKVIRTFILRPIDPRMHRSRIVRSSSTASDESFKLAYQWVSQCSCADFWKEPGQKWYPRRLLDIRELRNAFPKGVDGPAVHSKIHRFARLRVRLVESADANVHASEANRYVTLSHCWGPAKKVKETLRLCTKTEQEFKRNGIALSELSKTFLEAVIFASRLEGVGFIWIDSLCIKQVVDKKEDSLDDWFEQSRFMEEVYRKSYLNLSATAASDGSQGLFFPRRPELLREDKVDVNICNVDYLSSVTAHGEGRKALDTLGDISGGGVRNFLLRAANKGKDDPPTKCSVIDNSFWDDLVDEAPINRRGWVFQEQLLAPRILHFCHDQIAWECSEFSDAEGHHQKGSILRAKPDDTLDEGRFKSLTEEEGLALRELRLNGYPDPDTNMESLHVYELWKRVVESYSRLNLTNSSDKLVALAGIAKSFSRDTKCDYVVGMWRQHLESQLLWEVREVFQDGLFKNPARRESARAPSFSWAAIDSCFGVLYSEVTDYGSDRCKELFLEVDKYELRREDPKNEFGMITEAFLGVKAKYLERIELRQSRASTSVPYHWRLWRSHPAKRKHDHYDMRFDAPTSDMDVLSEDAELYCMPVAFGPRTVKPSSRDLACLLLKLEPTPASSPWRYRHFKRFGITKLSELVDSKGQAALRERETDELICLC